MSSGNIVVQPRDIELLRGLFESRILTLTHISALYFDNKREAGKKRVQKLTAANLIQYVRYPWSPSLLRLTRDGYRHLNMGGRLDGYPKVSERFFERRMRVSRLTLLHELAVLDAKCALAVALRLNSTLSLHEFSTWPALYKFNMFHLATRQEVLVRPDGFMRIWETQIQDVREHLFFVEIDRSTEALDTLVAKMQAYRTYFHNGQMAARVSGESSDYKRRPFRVLLVCETQQRRQNVAKKLLTVEPPIRTLVWLAVKQDLLCDPLGAIWTRPADYAARSATEQSGWQRHRQFRWRRESNVAVTDCSVRHRLINA